MRGGTLAKNTRSKQSKTTPDTPDDETIDDAIVQNDPATETPADDVAAADDTRPDDEPVLPEPEEIVFDEPETPVSEPEPEVTETPPEPVTPPVHHADSASNSIFLPAILGGLIAAGLGFAVAYTIIPRVDPELSTTVAENAYAIGNLRQSLEDATAQRGEVDLTPVTQQLTALRTQLTTEIDVLTDRIGTFDERLIALEKQPSSDGTLQESALQAYQRELDALRAQVEEQAGAAMDQLESTRAEAEAIEQSALQAAQAAQMRSALAQIQMALTTGAPMQAALTDLQDAMDAPLPDALTAVADGVPTLAKLQADFPNAARAALAAARSDGTSGEQTSAFGSFLREQLNVRSVAPRDGDDVDAILSRAQAAVSEGQLQTALDETEALPDVAKAELAEWRSVAQMRVDAVTATDDIALSLNVN